MSELALAGRVVSAPSASTVLNGRFPLTATVIPGAVLPPCARTPCAPPVAPAAPGRRILNLVQSCPTSGSAARVSAESVTVCSPFSVFNSGTSVLTTTSCVTDPIDSCASTFVTPTMTVIEDRTRVENPCFAKVSLYVPATIEDVSYTPA